MTYNDQNYPENGSVQKDAIPKFVRAIRQVIAPHKIHYGAAEYGENYDRPHYHMILFDLPATQTTKALLDKEVLQLILKDFPKYYQKCIIKIS